MAITGMAEYTNALDGDLEFTRVYRENLDQNVALREARCLAVLYPANFLPIHENDLFAGRNAYGQVGLGLEDAAGGPGLYCRAERIRQQLVDGEYDDSYRQRVEEMISFWEKETTIDGKLVAMLPEDVLAGTTNTIANMFGRRSGITLDFGKLVRLGLPGLQQEIEQGKQRAAKNGGDQELYLGMSLALDILAESCRHYAQEARQQAAEASTARQTELKEIAQTLEHIVDEPPKTMRQAAQLYWLYAMISGVVNYGRMDMHLGDFLAGDCESGELTEERALSLLQSLWQLMADRHIVFNGRVIIGGKGRENEENADRFAMLAMEATRTVLEIEPQLTLRFYDGQDPKLMQKGLAVVGEGRTFPMLYNDDVNIPAVAKAFSVTEQQAASYYPYGCGEYTLDHISVGSPNCSLNLLQAVSAVIFNGMDPISGERFAPQLGEFEGYENFDQFFAAYQKMVEYHVEKLAERHAMEYQAHHASAADLYCSMLVDGCLERGKSIVNRGPLFTGGVIESFGLVNAADSLNAVKQLVYEQKKLQPGQLREILAANFDGHQAELQLMLSIPKYGNDDQTADTMAQAVSDHACDHVRAQAKRVGFDYFLMVNINNKGNVERGQEVAASPEGRKQGMPLANANNPTAGMDRNGTTAFLNSLTKLDPSKHAGYVQNMKFSKQMFAAQRDKLDALLETYWAKGGTQAMITVVDRGDLEAAIREPEKHANLIVRVGGFSARFVELPQDVQEDVLRRTLN